MMPLTAEEIAAVEERCEKATPEPWTAHDDITITVRNTVGVRADSAIVCKLLMPWGMDEANFIAHARQDLPRALEGNRRWLEAEAWIRERLKESAHLLHKKSCAIQSPATGFALERCTCGLRALLAEPEVTT